MTNLFTKELTLGFKDIIFEFNKSKFKSIFNISLSFDNSVRVDHPNTYITLELLSFGLTLEIEDKRHWDKDNKIYKSLEDTKKEDAALEHNHYNVFISKGEYEFFDLSDKYIDYIYIPFSEGDDANTILKYYYGIEKFEIYLTKEINGNKYFFVDLQDDVVSDKLIKIKKGSFEEIIKNDKYELSSELIINKILKGLYK